MYNYKGGGLMVNRTEQIFRKSLNKYTDWYFMKLQVNELAHCKTPADFLILTPQFRYLVECKQVKLKDGKGAFSFNRLTQEEDLFYFEDKQTYNRSFILIAFLERYLKKSSLFLIPIYSYKAFIQRLGKKSGNLKDFNKELEEFKVDIVENELDLGPFLL